MSRPDDMDCQRVRKQAYRYRRDELIGAETDAIDAHLAACESCKDYYERLGILLEAATDWEPEPLDESSADDLFAGITARIEREEPSDDDVDDVADADEFVAPTPRRWMGALAGLAAGVLLTLAGLYVYQHLSSTQGPAKQGQVKQDQAKQGQRTQVADQRDDEPSTAAEDPADASSARPFRALARDDSDFDQVSVFASDGAKWSLSGQKDDKQLTLDVDEGTLLVEFIPEGGRTLAVDAPDFSVQVVGTIFFVSTDKDLPRAGVLAGKVEVRHGEETTALEAGREVDASFEPRAIPAARKQTLSGYVDTEAHLATLARLRGASKRRAPEKQRAPKTEAKRRERPPADAGVRNAAHPEREPTADKEHRLPPDLERLRARAERATKRGHYQDAVRYYRSLLGRLPPMHPIAASVHLDLAQIYLHRLNSPGRAAPHLRTFVERWPSDVAAPSARRELCKIAEQTGEAEPGCEVQP